MDSDNSFSVNDSLNNSLDLGLPTSDVENILVDISISDVLNIPSTSTPIPRVLAG